MTKSQKKTLLALQTLGGWRSNSEIVAQGGASASLSALCDQGFIEKQINPDCHFGPWTHINKWRAITIMM